MCKQCVKIAELREGFATLSRTDIISKLGSAEDPGEIAALTLEYRDRCLESQIRKYAIPETEVPCILGGLLFSKAALDLPEELHVSGKSPDVRLAFQNDIKFLKQNSIGDGLLEMLRRARAAMKLGKYAHAWVHWSLARIAMLAECVREDNELEKVKGKILRTILDSAQPLLSYRISKKEGQDGVRISNTTGS